ncbi:MAG: beta-ketoacyl-ACP reductase [Frankiales bacterium]|nr:beta-ketoacyl-ACP reductase [Frankiales bacterium]
MSGVQGRIALVTGAAQGIGAAIARRFAADGAAVGLLDVNAQGVADVAADIEAAGGRAVAVGADVGDSAQVSTAVERIAGELGGLHILVNNAGLLRDNLLFKMTEDDWDTVIRVHLRGAFLCSKAVQQYMVQARYGRIISMSSTSALGKRGQANYATVKAGLQGLTKTLAVELGPFGVTANAIAPGFIETAMTRSSAERTGSTIDEMREGTIAATPTRSAGVPDDVAHVAAFLAAEESGYLTGQVIYLDGGRGLV